MIFWHHPALPELTDGIANTHPDGLPIFPDDVHFDRLRSDFGLSRHAVAADGSLHDQ